MDQQMNHYSRLAGALNVTQRMLEPIAVSIEQLAEILCCTPRNVKFILRRFEESGTIRWQPGRGRGHTSEITFLRGIDEVMEQALQDLIGKGKIKQGIELISQLSGNAALQERLLALLNKQMGYHSEAETTTGLDTLRISMSRRLEPLDTCTVYTAFEAFIIEQICSTLLTFDAGDKQFQPGLAHMWEVNEDHTGYIFYLRKGVRFHHGRVLTSRDVKETYLRLRDRNSPAIDHFKDVKQVEILGEHRIRFDLERPNVFFLHTLSSVYMSILPYDSDPEARLVGTGPYRLAELSEDGLVLAAFDDYYGYRPLLDRVEVWYLPEMGSGVRQYELPGLSADDSAQEGCSNNIDYPALGSRYMMFNFQRQGAHHELEFRRALQALYHPPALIRDLRGKRSFPASSFMPWESQVHKWRESSLPEIREMLLESGYQGEEITLAYASFKAEEREDSLWLQRRAEAAGLRLRLLTYDRFQMEAIIDKADIFMAEEVLEDDWEWGMLNYFVNKSNLLHTLLLPDQLKALESELNGITSLAAEGRRKLLLQGEQLLYKQCWLLHGCHMKKQAQLNQSLFGLHTGSFGFLDISRLWIKPGFPERVSGPYAEQ
ncbi:ABC transporter substrate-binding protein [Paenibacillus tengchongensis]|uniref:ABC transporter substrate-binding protein n=1 Tax=Paenibacillus tengchongensis TaxID=2608684 RepID=UPI00124DA05C|nr:ABC transporter substrate-binding protein [Paenibacillus tengchongensis]